MVSRRSFLGLAIAASLAPKALLESTPKYTHHTYGTAKVYLQDGTRLSDQEIDEIGARYAKALAASMLMTREVVSMNVLNAAFDETRNNLPLFQCLGNWYRRIIPW